MAEPGERLAHLLVLDRIEDSEFRRKGRGDRKIRDVERRAHGEAMQRGLASAIANQDQARDQSSIEELEALGVLQRCVALSFSRARLEACRRGAPNLPTGWITLKESRPLPGTELLGPYWPLLLVNPLYVALAHRRGQAVAPLDPSPGRRLWLWKLLRCDAVLTDDPAETVRQLGRRPPRI